MHPIRLRLPATSANLGPGFDAVGLAMALYLTIDATAAPATASADAAFTIEATGRDAHLCGRVDRNLILHTYRDVLLRADRNLVPLHLRIHNEIPIGMGCGSSAAALLAGVLLANRFGGLNWPLQTCMEEACRREGHPDNVAACALGAMTVSSWTGVPGQSSVATATCGQGLPWKLLLALPSTSLATEKARALLPAEYSRADAVANVQRTALLVAAFALGRGELLGTAMQDRLHQPYRMAACPLLASLLPLAGEPAVQGTQGSPGILGIALSGAGPGVLVVTSADASTPEIIAQIRHAAADPTLEVVETTIAAGVSQEPLPT